MGLLCSLFLFRGCHAHRDRSLLERYVSICQEATKPTTRKRGSCRLQNIDSHRAARKLACNGSFVWLVSYASVCFHIFSSVLHPQRHVGAQSSPHLWIFGFGDAVMFNCGLCAYEQRLLETLGNRTWTGETRGTLHH